jgi:hypothetical protein
MNPRRAPAEHGVRGRRGTRPTTDQ